MKTIEERADEYATRICSSIPYDKFSHVKEDFSNGARSEHEELTRWNSQKMLPETNLQVLVKVESHDGEWVHFALAHVNKGRFIIEGNMFEKGDNILGWREIHE